MIALSIALGGAFGALARFLVNQLMIANGFGAAGFIDPDDKCGGLFRYWLLLRNL